METLSIISIILLIFNFILISYLLVAKLKNLWPFTICNSEKEKCESGTSCRPPGNICNDTQICSDPPPKKVRFNDVNQRWLVKSFYTTNLKTDAIKTWTPFSTYNVISAINPTPPSGSPYGYFEFERPLKTRFFITSCQFNNTTSNLFIPKTSYVFYLADSLYYRQISLSSTDPQLPTTVVYDDKQSMYSFEWYDVTTDTVDICKNINCSKGDTADQCTDKLSGWKELPSKNWRFEIYANGNCIKSGADLPPYPKC